MVIYFYVPSDTHGYLSNFSPHGFAVDGVYWPTVEHYFQAQKSDNPEEQVFIGRAKTAKEAKARGRAVHLRPEWELIKDEVMFRALKAKFETHDDIAKLLIETRDQKLIEAAPSDYYWGAGADGSGKNRLGELLMQVRDLLKSMQ